MLKSIAKFILKITGWKVSVTVPDYSKCIICVAPHTSNWDFLLGELSYWSVGRRAGFLMKSTWFFFPMNLILKALGGIPVERKAKKVSLTEVIIEKFRSTDHLVLAITPEGTRKRTTEWHTGFLRIAYGAGVPIVLGAIDYPSKRIVLDNEFAPSGDIEADLRAVKDFYKPFTGKYPEKFSAE